MNKYFDFFLNLFRWPVAIFLLFSIPALIDSFNYFDFKTQRFYAFAGGAILYFAMMIIVGSNVYRTMQIISHELTHTVFALLTFHDAGKIRINPDGSGGSMQVKGGGNWLITLSPYFLPLFAFLYMLIMPGLLQIGQNHWLVHLFYGYLIAYYWATIIDQVHPKQTDIIREGYLFSTIIIVGSNLYISGLALAFNSQQWDGIVKYLRMVHKFNLQYWPKIMAFIGV